MGSKCAKAVRYGLAAAVILAIGAAYFLTRLRHQPDEPLQISRNFVDLVQAGDLDAAYRLTDRGTSVGSTPAAFEVNIRRQLGIDAFPTHRPVALIGARGGDQSCGNRLRRWIMGRKIDPDQVSVDYVAGPPFEVRLRSDGVGGWRITFFQSHAM
jgi:hypothetical protein